MRVKRINFQVGTGGSDAKAVPCGFASPGFKPAVPLSGERQMSVRCEPGNSCS